MVVYQASTVTIELQESTKILTQNWKGFSSSEVFREAIDKSLVTVKQNGVKAILNNTLEQAVVKPEDSQYAAGIMPKFFANGLRAMAIVIPKNIFTQMSLKKFEEETKGANVKMFTTTTDAMDWIKRNI